MFRQSFSTFWHHDQRDVVYIPTLPLQNSKQKWIILLGTSEESIGQGILDQIGAVWTKSDFGPNRGCNEPSAAWFTAFRFTTPMCNVLRNSQGWLNTSWSGSLLVHLSPLLAQFSQFLSTQHGHRNTQSTPRAANCTLVFFYCCSTAHASYLIPLGQRTAGRLDLFDSFQTIKQPLLSVIHYHMLSYNMIMIHSFGNTHSRFCTQTHKHQSLSPNLLFAHFEIVLIQSCLPFFFRLPPAKLAFGSMPFTTSWVFLQPTSRTKPTHYQPTHINTTF